RRSEGAVHVPVSGHVHQPLISAGATVVIDGGNSGGVVAPALESDSAAATAAAPRSADKRANIGISCGLLTAYTCRTAQASGVFRSVAVVTRTNEPRSRWSATKAPVTRNEPALV